MKEITIKPSELKRWDEIDQSKATGLDSVCNHPERYGWYLIDGKYWPHRFPTWIEEDGDRFNAFRETI